MTSSLKQRAYETIRGKIMRGELPAGSHLSEQRMAREMGTSRGPVREAVNRLQSEGLLDELSGVGSVVPRLDERNFTEYYDLRILLESHAAAKACRWSHVSDLAGLNTELRAMFRIARAVRSGREKRSLEQTLHQFRTHDAQFHLELMRLAGNRLFMKVMDQTSMIVRMFFTFDTTPSTAEEITRHFPHTALEHAAMFRAIRRRDQAGARRAMKLHLVAGKHAAVSLFKRKSLGSAHWSAMVPGSNPQP